MVAVDNREASLKIIETLQQHFPNVIILARAWDLIHCYELMDRNVKHIQRETFDSALLMGEQALVHLGAQAYEARRAAQTFKKHDLETVLKLYAVHKDDKQIISVARQAREEVEKLFQADQIAVDAGKNKGWD